MNPSQKRLDALTQYREAAVAALEKSNTRIAELHAALDRCGAEIPVTQFDSNLITALESAGLHDEEIFRTVKQEALDRDRQLGKGDDLPSDADVERKYEECGKALYSVQQHCRGYLEELQKGDVPETQ